MGNPVFGVSVQLQDEQPQRTSLVSRTEHNLLNKNKAWNSGVETAQLICAFVLFFAKTGFPMMRLINNFILESK